MVDELQQQRDGTEVEDAEASDAEQRRILMLMRMHWRREREASSWQRAVFIATRRASAATEDDVLSEADLAFLEFIADQAVRELREKWRK